MSSRRLDRYSDIGPSYRWEQMEWKIDDYIWHHSEAQMNSKWPAILYTLMDHVLMTGEQWLVCVYVCVCVCARARVSVRGES